MGRCGEIATSREMATSLHRWRLKAGRSAFEVVKGIRLLQSNCALSRVRLHGDEPGAEIRAVRGAEPR